MPLIHFQKVLLALNALIPGALIFKLLSAKTNIGRSLNLATNGIMT
ncbi:MAG: hypothetical protein KME35_10785 [Aphanocapsa sp. GSE-SYN-MK-11-07L]|nr:hypothetical protein [Aphanocapsa sp. GSE-SYN-MK-11-07L]